MDQLPCLYIVGIPHLNVSSCEHRSETHQHVSQSVSGVKLLCIEIVCVLLVKDAVDAAVLIDRH